jgi:hypothetical protein
MGIAGIVVASLCASCWGYPIIDINVAHADRRGLELHFERCTTFGKVPHVSRLKIRKYDAVFCELDVADRAKPLPLGSWTYGRPVAGFVLNGRCEPLQPGTYRVDIEGSGAGTSTIDVGDDGQAVVKSPPCSL